MLELEGISLKIGRALKHRHELERVIQSFLQTNPYGLFLDPQLHKGYHIVRVQVLKHPPAEIGVIVGDIAHNLRSALDHLACQFVISNGSSPSTQTAFPLFYEDPQATEKARLRWNDMTKGMSPAAIRFIDDCQPYKIRHLPDPHHLSILSALSNWDKHHDIHAVGGYLGGLEIVGTGALFKYRETAVFARIADQAELCRFKTAQGLIGPETKMDLRAKFTLCFDSPKSILNRDPIGYLLERVWRYVAADVVKTVSDRFR